jgi:hypothetical protein
MEGTRRKMTLAVLCAFGVSACSYTTPPLGRGLPRDFVPTPDFDRRVKERFPVGSDESKLIAELHDERFATTETQDPSSPYRFSALYVAQGIACRESWRVRWKAEQGRIVEIEGWYGPIGCLPSMPNNSRS